MPGAYSRDGAMQTDAVARPDRVAYRFEVLAAKDALNEGHNQLRHDSMVPRLRFRRRSSYAVLEASHFLAGTLKYVSVVRGRSGAGFGRYGVRDRGTRCVTLPPT